MIRAATLIGLFFALSGSAAEPAPVKYKPVDKATLEAFEKLRGCTAGVLVPTDAFFKDRKFSYDEKEIAKGGGLPAFSFSFGLPDQNLPPVGVPHGIEIGLIGADADLAKLKAMKNLVWLDLFSAKVTDAGVKELAGLKSLQSINLGYAKVTDAGLKAIGVSKISGR